MKYAATILMNLLLLGVCFARSMDTSKPSEMDDMKLSETMKPRETDFSKATQDYRRESEQYRAEEENTQQWTQFREGVYQKLRNMYQQLTTGNNYPIDSIPQFADPLYVGHVEGQYGTFKFAYDNVKFHGLYSADQAFVNVDPSSEEATLTLSLTSGEIRGQYETINSGKTVSGTFAISMVGDLNFVSTYRYHTYGSQVQLQHWESKLKYDTPNSFYQNADFPDFIQGPLQATLLKAINEKIYSEVHSKLGGQVQQSVQASTSGYQQDTVDKFMREGIKNVVHGIQQVISKRGVFSIGLTSDEKEMVYNKLHAKIESIRLNGLEKFYMANNQVSKENSDKIRSKLQLAINRPTATAVLNVHESHDDNAPFRKVSVDFDMEELMAELSLEKATRQSVIELRSVETKVNRIRPMSIEKFDNEVRNLIKEKLAGLMKRNVEEGLKNFIQNEYLHIMNRGFMPPSQENRSAHNRM